MTILFDSTELEKTNRITSIIFGVLWDHVKINLVLLILAKEYHTRNCFLYIFKIQRVRISLAVLCIGNHNLIYIFPKSCQVNVKDIN